MEDPYHVTSSGELSVSFAASKRVRLTAQLIGVVESAGEDCSQYVLQQAESEQLVSFVVRLPKIGTYKLEARLFTVLHKHLLYSMKCYSSIQIGVATGCAGASCFPPKYPRLL